MLVIVPVIVPVMVVVILPVMVVVIVRLLMAVAEASATVSQALMN